MKKLLFKNNKYFLGDYTKTDINKGWFVGAFFDEGHPCKTDSFEILYREHISGDIEKSHYHEEEKLDII